MLVEPPEIESAELDYVDIFPRPFDMPNSWELDKKSNTHQDNKEQPPELPSKPPESSAEQEFIDMVYG